MKSFGVLTAAVVLCLGATGAHAGDVAPHADRWEARIGGGIYDVGLTVPHDFDGGTLNAEVLAPSPGFLEWLGSPRPYIGTDVALSSDPVHFLYAGLNWEARLVGGFYVGLGLGGSVNTDSEIGPRDLGSNVLFHLQLSAGLDINDNTALQLYVNHYSNANLASANDGLETAGARLAFRF